MCVCSRRLGMPVVKESSVCVSWADPAWAASPRVLPLAGITFANRLGIPAVKESIVFVFRMFA